MTHGKKDTKRPAWQTDFVRCDLTKEMKVELAKFDTSGVASFEWLTGAVSDGYKFSATNDERHDCVAVFLTEGVAQSGKRKRCLSARGGEFLPAIRALYYKHSVILEGDWGNAREDDDGTDSWG